VRPGAVISPEDAPMASPEVVSILEQKRQAIEASHQPVSTQSPALVKAESAAAPRG